MTEPPRESSRPPAAPPLVAPAPIARPPGAVETPRPLSGMESYNVVSDTLIGVNVRWRDNLVQLLAVVGGVFLGAAVGALVHSRDRVTGAVAGAFAGLLAGLLLSGAALMIYRGLRHARGRHD